MRLFQKKRPPFVLLLSYDQSIKIEGTEERKYEGEDFRKILIENFIKFEKSCVLASPVSSTVYIRTFIDEEPLEKWAEHIKKSFDDDFFFTLAVLHPKTEFTFERETVANVGLRDKFSDMFSKISDELRQ